MDTFVFLQFLHQILVKFQNQGQFWNLHVLSFPKLSLILKFDQLEAEKIEVKDTRGLWYCKKVFILRVKKTPLVSFISIFSASSWSNFKIRNSFGKLRTCKKNSQHYSGIPGVDLTIQLYKWACLWNWIFCWLN